MKNIKFDGGSFKKGLRESSTLKVFSRGLRFLGKLTPAFNSGQRAAKGKTPEKPRPIQQFIDAIDTTRRALTAKKVVTLDINGNYIKLLEVRGRMVTRWAGAPFELNGTEKEDEPARLNALGTAVKQLMVKSGIKTNKVILSVSGLNSINRIMQSAGASVELLNQDAVRILVDEEMALTREQLYLSWKVIRPANGEWQIYIMAIIQDVLDAQISSLKRAGINPHVIESKAVTLSRVANKKNTLILNIEPFSFDVVVVADSIPIVSHTNAWQADAMDVEDKAEQLILALRLITDFSKSSRPEAVLETPFPLCIVGQLSADADLMARLRAIPDYDIEPMAPPIQYPEDFVPPEYASNIGLALRDTAQTGNQIGKFNIRLTRKPPDSRQTYDTYESLAINLLPRAYHGWRPSSRQLASVAAIIIAPSLIIPLSNAVSKDVNQTSLMKRQYDNLNNVLERRKLEIKNREPLAARINEYNTITTMAGYYNKDLRLIRDIADNQSVQLLSLTHEGKLIDISAEADSNALKQFATALMDSGQFVSVTLPDAFWGYPQPTLVNIKLRSKMGK